MPRRRDRTTRSWSRYNKRYSGQELKETKNNLIRDMNRVVDSNRIALGYSPRTSNRGGIIAGREAPLRQVGRRGVRARARNARIRERLANGTYRQPSGGTITNS